MWSDVALTLIVIRLTCNEEQFYNEMVYVIPTLSQRTSFGNKNGVWFT